MRPGRSRELSGRATPAPLWVRVRGAVSRRVARARKILWQRRHLDPSSPRRAVFLVGCQRSGTNMFHAVVGAAPEVIVYNEDARRAFRDFRLRDHATIERLVRASPAPVVLLKPLCDSHLIDRILDAHPESRALWMFRRYPDVVNSMIHMWGAHQADVIRALVARRWDILGWRGERLSDSMLRQIDAVWREDGTDHEAGVLMWVVRNHFFFELGLEADARVRLVRYEDLVTDPVAAFPPVFRFLGCAFDPDWARGVVSDSVRKEALPAISAEIAELAEGMQARLEAAFEAQREVEGQRGAPPVG